MTFKHEPVPKPPLGNVILLHGAAGEEGAPCVYCGKPQPWGDMEPCDGPSCSPVCGPPRCPVHDEVMTLHPNGNFYECPKRFEPERCFAVVPATSNT